MKKLLISLFLACFPVLAFAQGTLQDALALAPEPPPLVVPLKFRNLMIHMFGEEQYDKMQSTNNISFVAKNTQKLANKTADKYMRMSHGNCRGRQVVVGIGKNGELQCGMTGRLLVKVRSGTGLIDGEPFQNDTFEVIKQTTISTGINEQMELVFPDDSIIRMDADTKIVLNPIPKNNNNTKRTLAQIAFNKGLLWGRVFSDEGPEFRKDDYIAGVRGTSILIDKNGFHALQSQNAQEAMTIRRSQEKNNDAGNKKDIVKNHSGIDKSKDDGTIISIPPCSTWSNGSMTQHANDTYCLKDNDIITDFTKKDIAYINSLLTAPICDTGVCADVKRERDIAGPKMMSVQKQFCPEENKPLFFAGAVHAKTEHGDGMCFDDTVFAVATITPGEAKIVWKNDIGEWETIYGTVRIGLDKTRKDKWVFGAEFKNISPHKNAELYTKIKELNENMFEYIQNQTERDDGRLINNNNFWYGKNGVVKKDSQTSKMPYLTFGILLNDLTFWEDTTLIFKRS